MWEGGESRSSVEAGGAAEFALSSLFSPLGTAGGGITRAEGGSALEGSGT